ncbi:hypothetical protein ACW9HQ_53960, partial [Nocardia gipuzkoensis]
MGGLVARWCIEKCGIAEVTRKLITLGTPYRGAATAIDRLVNGIGGRLPRLGSNLTELARSLPSLYQLLPDYACTELDGSLRTLDEMAIPELDSAMFADARDFHADLARAEAARPQSLETTHAVVGVGQPTMTTVRRTSAGLQLLDTIGNENDYG